MMHAVIRTSNDCIHLIGHVDAYNVESLRDHVRGMGRAGDVSVVIDIAPADKGALIQHAGRWLSRLAGSGVPVRVQSGPRPISLPSRRHAA